MRWPIMSFFWGLEASTPLVELYRSRYRRPRWLEL
jgi:hypothetical protein